MPVLWDAAVADHPLLDAALFDHVTLDAAGHDSGDPLAAWHWRVRLSLDNGSGPEELIDFPVLVVLDNARIRYADIAADGADLRFVAADDVTPLPHEVESWNGAGRSFIWVRVPRIAAQAVDSFIWLYYGNPTAASAASPAAVWSNHFRAVYHLRADLVDSTALAAPGIAHGTTTVSGVIGQAASFAGVSYIDLGPNLTAVQGIGGCTISFWLKPDAIVSIGSQYLVSYSISTPGNLSRASVALLESGEMEVWGRSVDTEESQAHVTAGAGIISGSWSHLVGTIDYPADTVAAFVNGGPVGQTTVNFASATTPHAPSANSALGAEDDGIDCYFAGALDEVRVADVVRSAGWIAAEFRTARDDGFVVYGAPEAHE